MLEILELNHVSEIVRVSKFSLKAISLVSMKCCLHLSNSALRWAIFRTSSRFSVYLRCMISCVEVMRLNLYVSFSEPFRFLFYDENEIVEAEQLDFGSPLQIWFAILYPTRCYMNFCLTWTYYWEEFPKINNLVFLMANWNLNLINHHCHKAISSDFLD